MIISDRFNCLRVNNHPFFNDEIRYELINKLIATVDRISGLLAVLHLLVSEFDAKPIFIGLLSQARTECVVEAHGTTNDAVSYIFFK